KCYVCGNRLSEKDFCTNCGADVSVYKRILRISNKLYNDGLEKANVRDLSGATVSLKQSLKYNKRNIEARNLLGLVYFEMGEAVLALSEWIISKNLESKKNIADDYIQELQSNPTQLDMINQTIKKYNQALTYCYQESQDLAVIQLKKVLSINQNLISGYQLLALLYISVEDYEKARRTLLRAIRIDANNTITLRYLKEINTILREKEAHSGSKKKKAQKEVFSYQSGNDMIIQPVYTKERAGFSSIINIVIGIVIGIAICWFLILPARVEIETDKNDEKFIEVSEELSNEKANSQEIEQTLTAVQKENEDLKAQVEELTGESGLTTVNDYLIQAALAYINAPDDSETIMDALGSITEDNLNEASQPFISLYTLLHEDAAAKAIAVYVDNGNSAMKSNDYETAIEEYTKAWNLDNTNSDVLMNLAHAYRKAENTDKADELYRLVIADFPDTQNAADAEGYITETDN
ncbi:MAG TPA: tetratricopeptide repeat protein, partial [Lachnospiraceae bacterium]|nr:tetratricopeptide repeat protein [Lachnospiraceae bacterium]